MMFRTAEKSSHRAACANCQVPVNSYRCFEEHLKMRETTSKPSASTTALYDAAYKVP